MILTEDKTYTISLETEDDDSESGLTSKTIELEFSSKELIHAIVCCGTPAQRLTAAFPEKKRFELIYKLFMLETALEGEGDRLKKSKRTAFLDSSEKSVITYYIGMIFTGLISRRLYDVKYLTGLNQITSGDKEGFIDFFASEWRSELIGYKLEDSEWSAWEAKGGSNRREQALTKGTQQLNAISSINGCRPDPGAVCMTYFDHSFLCGIIREPAESSAGEQLAFSDKDFFRAYYKPLCELFVDRESHLRIYDSFAEISLNIPYFTEKYREPDTRTIRVGMPVKLLNYLIEEDYNTVAKMRKNAADDTCPEGAFLGSDGIYIR